MCGCKFGERFFLGNIVFNLIFGIVGDKFGWKNTVIWFGGVGCGIFTLLLYYAPVFSGGSLAVVSVIGFIWGGLLAGYVPIGAIVPTVAGKDKGAAMSVLNLAAGLSAFVGPHSLGCSSVSSARKAWSGSLRPFTLQVRS